MFIIIGVVIVFGAVIGGYLMEHGNLSLLYQPAEFVIIGGAALGMFVIASPKKVIKGVQAGIVRMFASKAYDKSDYLDALVLLSEIFFKIRKEGLVSVESDIDEPEKSAIFKKYDKFLKNHHALAFLTDTLRTLTITDIEAHELDALLDHEIEAHHEELLAPSKALAHVADSLPGLGIVACVLGVVLTMKKISEPPEVLGHAIGAALVGTFLGILLSYGFVGPMAKNLENIGSEDKEYLTVLKAGIIAFVNTPSPQVAVEFARRVVPQDLRPSFLELEALIKKMKK